jgi:hypothetical protein
MLKEWTLLLIMSIPSPGGTEQKIQKMTFNSESQCHKMETNLRDTLDGQNFMISCVPLANDTKPQDRIGSKEKYRLDNMDYYIRKPCPYEICGKNN